jgi:hypothetical protein
MVAIRCPEKFRQAASTAASTKGEFLVIADVAHVHFAFADLFFDLLTRPGAPSPICLSMASKSTRTAAARDG